MTHPGKVRALLATARIANVPSVVSNVWVGVVVALLVIEADYFSWLTAAALAFSGICLYISGNFFNDWYDRDWDSKDRPERALPQGYFSPKCYFAAGSSLAVVGVLLAGWVSLIAAGIAICILIFIGIYTIVHKKYSWSVVPMGICRALLIYLGVSWALPNRSLFQPDVISFMAEPANLQSMLPFAGATSLGLLLHIVGLSLSARHESKSTHTRGINLSSALFLIVSILPVWPFIFESFNYRGSVEHFVGTVVYLLWISFCYFKLRSSVGRYVSGLLAGIPLVDWIFLLPLAIGAGWPESPHDLVSLFLPPAAFLLALLLQRVAPAT
jgi:hypothetical protein